VGHYLRKKGVALSNLTIMCQEFRALQIPGCDTSNSGSVDCCKLWPTHGIDLMISPRHEGWH
jgi:hypothetical protein